MPALHKAEKNCDKPYKKRKWPQAASGEVSTVTTKSVVKHKNRLPRKVVEGPVLEIKD